MTKSRRNSSLAATWVPLFVSATPSAVRVGDTVRRPVGPWTQSVDAVLYHLENVGFEGAPRALGYDERGRQVLSFERGNVNADPRDLGTARLHASVN